MDNPPIGPVLEKYGWNGLLTGYGAWGKMQCPFHGDRTASAALNEEEGLFVCHAGCFEGKVLTAFGIIMQVENTDFPSAKAKVKELTGHDAGSDRGSVSRGASGKLTSSKLPQWARDQSARDRLVSSRSRRRKLV